MKYSNIYSCGTHFQTLGREDLRAHARMQTDTDATFTHGLMEVIHSFVNTTHMTLVVISDLLAWAARTTRLREVTRLHET